ncbi:uncharacterized protein LOC144158581 isoform X4 [Haemaphysalis longicornis]
MEPAANRPRQPLPLAPEVHSVPRGSSSASPRKLNRNFQLTTLKLVHRSRHTMLHGLVETFLGSLVVAPAPAVHPLATKEDTYNAEIGVSCAVTSLVLTAVFLQCPPMEPAANRPRQPSPLIREVHSVP